MCFPLFLSCLSSCLQSCRSAKEAKDFVSGAIASSAHLALGNGTQGPMNHSHLHCTRHRYTQQLKSFQKVGSENQKLKFVLCFCDVFWRCLRTAETGVQYQPLQKLDPQKTLASENHFNKDMPAETAGVTGHQ